MEIGGINPKFFSQNPPAAALEPWLHNESAYNLHLAESLPQVSIVKTKVKALSNDPDGATHEIDVTVENSGRIPTALEQAKQVKIVRPDTVSVQLPQGSGSVVGDAPSFYLKGQPADDGRRQAQARRDAAGLGDGDRLEHARRRGREHAALVAGVQALGGRRVILRDDPPPSFRRSADPLRGR